MEDSILVAKLQELEDMIKHLTEVIEIKINNHERENVDSFKRAHRRIDDLEINCKEMIYRVTKTEEKLNDIDKRQAIDESKQVFIDRDKEFKFMYYGILFSVLIGIAGIAVSFLKG